MKEETKLQNMDVIERINYILFNFVTCYIFLIIMFTILFLPIYKSGAVKHSLLYASGGAIGQLTYHIMSCTKNIKIKTCVIFVLMIISYISFGINYSNLESDNKLCILLFMICTHYPARLLFIKFLSGYKQEDIE